MNETTRVIRIVVDSSKARSGSEESRQALKRMEDQVAATRSSMDKLSAGWSGMMRGFAAATALLAVVASVKAFATGIAEAGDEIRSTTARFNVLTGAADGSRTALDAIYKVARNTGIVLGDAGAAFSRLAIAAGEFGATTDQIARVTDVVLKLGRVGGATGQELSAGVQQLGQALASGRLQGDELRSILEGMPLVGKAIAKEFGVGLGELKKLGEEGKLVSDRVFKALIAAGSDADAQFKKLPPTLEAAGNRASNAWKLFSAALDDSLGISRLLASGLDATADRAERVAARIRGDVNVALQDTINKIDALEKRGPGTAPPLPLSAPARADLGGANQPPSSRQLYELRTRGRGTPVIDAFEQRRLQEHEAELARLRLQRTGQQNEAADWAYREMQAYDRSDLVAAERAKAAREKRAKDTREEADKLRASYDKELAVTRQLADARKTFAAEAEASGRSQAWVNQQLAKYEAGLRAAGGAAKATAESVKALNEATREADFAKLLADNAGLGAGRLAEIEAQAKAVEKAIDTLGKRDAVFEGRYAGQLLSKRGDDFRKDFTLETAEIERQNRLLEAQVRLAGERPEIAEREIALLRVRNEIEAKGQDAAKVNVEARVEALVAQEKLNRQLEDGKRSAELWAEPFKNAIQSVQSTMTDFFEKLLSGGIRSFGDLGAALKSIWFRLMAEMASVAVIRPVIQFAVGGASSLGLIGPQTAQAFGVSGGGGSGGGLGSSLTGGGFNPFGMFGQGGSDGMLGRVGSFLSSPISGLPGAAAFEGVIPGMSGSAAQQYINGASGGGIFGTTTWGQGLGALAGVGSSILSFANGNPIGGAAGLLGAGVSLIPGIGQVAGPVIGILGGILGSLFKSKPDIKAQGVHDYDIASGRYGSRVPFAQGVAAPLAPGVGNDALKLLGAFGGSVGEGRVAPSYYLWRGFDDGRMDASVTVQSPTYARLMAEEFASGVSSVDQAQWQARRNLWTDKGNVDLPVSGLSTDSNKLMQQLALLILKAGVRDDVFVGLTDTSKSIIRNYPDADTQGLGQALEWGRKTYDVLQRGDTITAAEKAFTDLRDSFQAAILKAEEYGLATDKLVEAQGRAINKYATDFGRNIEDQLLGISDPAALQRLQVEREREQALKEWDYLQQEFLKGNIGTLIERNKVQQLYDEKLKSIFSQTLVSLENFERRVRFGDLSAANPLESLAGTLGAYRANAAQALAGDAAAINQYEAFAEAAIQAQRAYGGNDYAAADLRERILAEIAAIQGRGAGTPAAAMDELIATNQELARLMRQFLDRMQSG